MQMSGRWLADENSYAGWQRWLTFQLVDEHPGLADNNIRAVLLGAVRPHPVFRHLLEVLLPGFNRCVVASHAGSGGVTSYPGIGKRPQLHRYFSAAPHTKSTPRS